MKAAYVKYTINYQATRCTVLEQGEIELPAEGHGIFYRLLQAFPGFEMSRMTVGKEDYRMHSKDWKTGIAITISK